MISSSQPATATEPAFELKGRMLTLSVLRLLTDDLDQFARQLDAKVAEAPGMFRQMPVLLDLDAAPRLPELSRLCELLRERGLMPVGVRPHDEAVAAAAAKAGLGLLSAGQDSAPRRVEAKPAQPSAGLLVTQTVRSGQQVYARGGDLVVLASVGAGAELLADGHIHVYGTLRGRALAGVQGNAEARIFCHNLDAELVSIAGNYRVSENILDGERGRPVQIQLVGDSLRIDPIHG